MTSVLRKAVVADAEKLAHAHAQCFEDVWDAAWFRALIDQPSVMGIVAPENAAATELQGFVLIRIAAEEAEILSLGIIPACRRSGLARQLLQAAMTTAGNTGAAEIFLEVAADNKAARGLYEGEGFASCGLRRGYYQRGSGPPADAIMLRATLPNS